jgi:hypothetical protein
MKMFLVSYYELIIDQLGCLGFLVSQVFDYCVQCVDKRYILLIVY